MKNYIYIIVFNVFFFGFAQENVNIGPSVVTGCGGSLQGWSMVSLKSDFTLGQIAIETVMSDEFMLTQGFHQADLNIVRLNEENQTRINVFPNPTASIVNVEFLEIINEKLEIILFDSTGKIIYSNKIDSNMKSFEINMTNLSVGTYFIEVVSTKNKDLFKIQKLKK